jgi:hypothetical protein
MTSAHSAASAQNTIITIGVDDHGQWLVEENHGLLGGIFVSRAAAIGFARAEIHAFPGARLIEIAAAPRTAH